jgi:ADP-ribosylglycohydrolase
MLGAIAGDIIGSAYELNNVKTKDFELFDPSSLRLGFTDDTVMTVALMDAIMNNKPYGITMQKYFRKYPDAGYGFNFHSWCIHEEVDPYDSWGNGSAMRTSPVAYAFHTIDDVVKRAAHYASITHNHPEGIKGAQAIASAIFLARTGSSKDDIAEFIVEQFDYDLDRSIDEIRPDYEFDVSCEGTVPEAIIAFLESTDYEDAIRNAVSIGGDSDTIACMTGGIAEAYYDGVPRPIASTALGYLTTDLMNVVTGFYHRYSLNLGTRLVSLKLK